MDFDALPYQMQKSAIPPVAARLAVQSFGLTLHGIDRGSGLDRNFTYRVSAREGKFLIRLYAPHYSEDRIRTTLWWQEELRAMGLRVQRPYPSNDPLMRIVPPEDQVGGYHSAVMFHWEDAVLLRELREDPRFPEMMHRFGVSVARWHEHSLTVIQPTARQLPARNANSLKTWMLRLASEPVERLHPEFDAYENHTRDELLDMAQDLLDWMEARPPKTHGIVHGDLNCDNILFDGLDPVLLDFAPLSVGYFETDLVKALDFAVPDQNHGDFLSGYTSIREVPTGLEESRALLNRTRACVPNWF